MNTDARHGCLRPKRCLPAEFHAQTAHYDPTQSNRPTRYGAPIRTLSIPKSGRTIVTAPKSANSRFFTDCYPISAVFAPKLNQTTARLATPPVLLSDHEVNN